MRVFCVLVFVIGSAAIGWSQTIYYATFSGENYAKETWHSASVSEFKASRPDNVYDTYTVERHSDDSVVVHRDFTTPSGDWRFELTYEYGPDGSLRKIRSEFVTFGGITISGEDEGLTRCVRTFSVSPSGALHKTSERITDEKSGRVVARQFYQPQIAHWMSLNQLPIQPKT